MQTAYAGRPALAWDSISAPLAALPFVMVLWSRAACGECMANPTNGSTKDAIVIRSCRAEELEELLLFWRQAGATLSLTDTAEDVRRAIAHPTACVLVADAGCRIVGSIFGGFDGCRGNIYRLAVHSEYRRQGVPRRVVPHADPSLLSHASL